MIIIDMTNSVSVGRACCYIMCFCPQTIGHGFFEACYICITYIFNYLFCKDGAIIARYVLLQFLLLFMITSIGKFCLVKFLQNNSVI